jgi:phytoene/squalene synthetase
MRVLTTIYGGLLERIAADPRAVFRRRVSVPLMRKLAILAGGAVGSLRARGRR